MGSRMNTIMQVCFFAISKVLPRDEAIEAIRESIRHTYGRKGEEVVQKNMKAVDETLAHLHEVQVPEHVTSKTEIPAAFPGAPKFEHDVLGAIYAGKGDELPVSAFSWTEPFPPARRSGRNAIWPSKFLHGIRRSASSAASAPWFARTLSSASRSTTARNSQGRQPRSNPATLATKSGLA